MIEQVYLTNLTRPHAAAHYEYIVNINNSIFCNTMALLEEKEQCTFVKKTESCHEMDVNIDYSTLLFCSCNIKEYREPCIMLFILLSAFYIMVIIVTVYTSLAPNIIAITKHRNLSEYGGGMFAIGFSCSLTGVLEVGNRYKYDTELIMNEVLTTNMHLRLLCSGLFLILKPIILQPLYYTRDQLFYVAGLLITFSFMKPDTLDLVAAIIGVSLYVFVLIIVFVQENLSHLQSLKASINEIHFQIQKTYATINQQSILKLNDKQTIFKQFLNSLDPTKREIAYRSNYWQKIILIMGLPVNTFIALCIPVYHPQLPLNGWSKLLNLLNLFIFPLLYSFFMFETTPIIIMITYFIAAIIFGIYVTIKSTANEPPHKFHIVFAYLGNLFCIGFIFIIESELMAVLTTLGYAFELSRPVIGLHILSLIRILATCTLAVTLASWGYHKMAYIIIVFSPLVLTNLSLSMLVLLKCYEDNTMRVHIRPGVNGYAGVVFLFIEFFTIFTAVILLNFHLRKSIGYYSLTYYVVFVFLKIFVATYFIHPYGTDHTIDADVTDVPWA